MGKKRRSSTGEQRKGHRFRHSHNNSKVQVDDSILDDSGFVEKLNDTSSLNNINLDKTFADNEVSHPSEHDLNTAFIEENDSEHDDVISNDLCGEFVGDFDVLTCFETLKRGLVKSVKSPYLLNSCVDEIQIIQLNHKHEKTAVKLKLVVDESFVPRLFVHNKEVPRSHDVWGNLPPLLDKEETVLSLLARLTHFCVCIGNPDPEYTALVDIGKGLSDKNTPGVLSYREGDFCASQGNLSFDSTIRSTKCSMLVAGVRCQSCSEQRRNLRKRKANLEHLRNRDCDFTKSSFKHADMPRDILIKKIYQQKDKIKSFGNELDKLKRDLRKEISKSGIQLKEHEDIEMKDLMSLCNKDVETAYPDSNCYQRLFWDQQLKFSQCGKFGMRWHPMIIRWCLYIRHKSSKAYDALRETGFINLPCNRTLFDYSHYVKSELGFQPDVLKMLKEEAIKEGMFDGAYKCFVGILFDEIKIKEDLVYDKHSGELIGYANLDSIGNSLMELDKMFKKSSSSVAKYMLVLMVRGTTSSLRFPLAGFSTMSITADFLYPIIWKAIMYLEVHIKLKVLFITCDGASANRKFFNMHKVDGSDCTYYTVNPHDRERNIYFISDIPHIMKTTRNCFSNSFSHKNTRRLWRNGKDISWLHIVSLFEEHCEMNLYTPCPKLKRQHIELNAFSYMKVNLAVQVLSGTVANALEELYDERVSETVNFIRQFNTLFDVLNVRHLFEGRNTRNSNLDPYRSVNDERLTWLNGTFLDYINSWGREVEERVGPFSQKERAGMFLSRQTVTGINISVKSITECVKYMLERGAPFILTHAFNQDPLEQHFGHYRQRGGANRNPTVNDVRHTMTNIRTIGAQALAPKRGNISTPDTVREIDNRKLPRRN